MRIIGGRHGGRRLRLASAAGLRPTADRVREAVFNILDHGVDWPGFEGIAIVDLFAGTGAWGLEALSRGAAHATFVDTNALVLQAVQRAAAEMGEASRIVCLRLNASRLAVPPRSVPAPVTAAFLDAPYNQGLTVPALAGLACRGWLASGAVVVVEVAAQEPLSLPSGYALIDERLYGAARLAILRMTHSLPAAS